MPLSQTYENGQWKELQTLKHSFESSPEHMIIIDPQLMKVVDANQSALNALGYTKDELLKLSPANIDAAFDDETIATAFEAIINSKEQQATFPAVHRRKDNSTFEVEVYLRSFKENGRFYILCSATDIGVLKKAQDDLKFHSTLFNNISDAIFSTDESFIITSWNKHAVEMFGWSKKEAIGKPIEILAPIIYPHLNISEARDLLFENGYWKGEIVTRRKNSETFTALISTGIIKANDGKITGTVSVAQDISERKKKDDEIKYLADLVNKVSDAIISVDKNYKIITWNKGAETIYGFAEEEVIGKCIFNLLAKPNLFSYQKEVENALQENGYWSGEATHYHKNDMPIWTLISVSVLKDENNIISGFVVVVKDITQRKNLEDELKKLNEELEQRVRDTTAEVVSIFDRITDGVVAVNNDWNFTYVNKKAGVINGKQPEGLIGKNLFEQFPELVHHSFYGDFHKAVAEQKTVHFNYFYAPFNKWLEGSIYPSCNGLSIYFRDITASKKSELALKESEIKYRTLVETANEGIWQVDPNSITIYVNRYLASLLGYTQEEMVGKSAFEFIAEDNKEKGFKNQQERRKGMSAQNEFTLINKKGEKISALVQSTPLYREEKYIGSISMLMDITQRKQTEEQLAANERRFRALIENSSDGIALLSANGTVLYNTPSGKKITGFKNQEIAGRHRLDFIHPDDHYKVSNALKDLLDNPTKLKKMELRFRVKEGGYKWLEACYTNLLHDPFVKAIVINYRDITERKKAERELRKSEKQLLLIYNNSTTGMWLVNVEGAGKFRFQTINAAFSIITRQKKEEVVGHLLEEVVPSGSIEDLRAKYTEAVQTKQVVSFFTTIQYESGEITVEIKIIPILNEEGKVVQLLGTGDNMTEQRKARHELMQMNAQLRELASHLQTIREDERTRIAREIHDELGQQLTVLKLDLSWLNKKLHSQTEDIENRLSGALKVVDTTMNTVRRIASDLRPSILDDLGLSDAMEWQGKQFTERTGVNVKYRYSGRKSKIPSNVSVGIFRIFQESLTNVARHAKATAVNCLVEDTGDMLRLTITDNGTGFDLNAIGERKTLGLLGMKERALMLNGKYTVSSEPGKGAVVSVTVPLA